LKWLDYYKILEVEANAELETIITAYRRKAFEYHPDRSNRKDAQERMYEVNKAYETLKDKALRSAYDVKWIEKHKSKAMDQFREVNLFESKMIEAAEQALINYFKAIQEQNYEEAYPNLFNNGLDVGTFVRWQKSVASVYRMIGFEYQYVKALKNKISQGNEIQYIVVFSVVVHEINKMTGYEESEILNKSVLYSSGEWFVYLDQVNIDAVISKYDKLSELKRRKFYLKKATMSKGSLILGIERELERYIRYGSPFSLAFFEIISKEE
jgi:DnaJ-domain-containing protein 1